MKEQATDHVIVSESDHLIDEESWPSASPDRNLEGKGKPKWYDFLPYHKFVSLLPQLRYLRGSKARFTITTFDEINKVCQQIFECHKSFFRYRTQVDLLAHYIGTKILEQIYIVQCNHRKNPISKLLDEQELRFVIWDQMKTIKEIFQGLCEKYVDGFVTEKEFDAHVKRYISTFESADDRIKMATVIERMMVSGEAHKASERVRKNYANKQRAIEKELRVIE